MKQSTMPGGKSVGGQRYDSLTSEDRLKGLFSFVRWALGWKFRTSQMPEEETTEEEALSLVLSWEEEELTPREMECLEWAINGNLTAT